MGHPNMVSESGSTPIHFACATPHSSIPQAVPNPGGLHVRGGVKSIPRCLSMRLISALYSCYLPPSIGLSFRVEHSPIVCINNLSKSPKRTRFAMFWSSVFILELFHFNSYKFHGSWTFDLPMHTTSNATQLWLPSIFALSMDLWCNCTLVGLHINS